MTKIILDVISGDFDVASANTFDSIIDEIVWTRWERESID